MRRGVYKHKYNTDVAMRVVKSFYVAAKDGWKIRVNWINIVNPNNHFVLMDSVGPITENHFIPRDKVKDWEPFDASV